MNSISVAYPAIGDEEIAAVADVMRSGMIASGPAVTRFEQAFSGYCGADHSVAVANGTVALHAALLALGIGAGDEVIVPSFSFIASATCVSMCGARPVFVDVDPATYTIDPEAVNAAITEMTKAIIGVHLFGHPFEVDAVSELCDDHSLALVEDAAQAHGAMYNGKRVGSFGDLACFSFYPTKNMTTGEGGMVLARDPEVARRVRQLVNHGQAEKYLHTMIGYNYRMTDIGAAIGLEQLKRLDGFNARRNRNAEGLSGGLQEIDGLVAPTTRDGMYHVFHQYVVRITDEFPLSRQALMDRLAGEGIGSAVHYPIPIHRQPVYRGPGGDAGCPVSTRVAAEVLSLPVHPGVTDEQVERICSVIREAARS